MLIVDHEATTAAILERAFVVDGWDVVVARTGTIGLWELASAPFDCVLVELGLPDGTCESILEAVAASRLPACMVVVTGMGDPARLMARLARFKPAAVLHKPLDIAAVRAACASARALADTVF
jgi:ActR/RegA family two-component response regulator